MKYAQIHPSVAQGMARPVLALLLVAVSVAGWYVAATRLHSESAATEIHSSSSEPPASAGRLFY